jgi:hypothetical protein
VPGLYKVQGVLGANLHEFAREDESSLVRRTRDPGCKDLEAVLRTAIGRGGGSASGSRIRPATQNGELVRCATRAEERNQFEET